MEAAAEERASRGRGRWGGWAGGVSGTAGLSSVGSGVTNGLRCGKVLAAEAAAAVKGECALTWAELAGVGRVDGRRSPQGDEDAVCSSSRGRSCVMSSEGRRCMGALVCPLSHAGPEAAAAAAVPTPTSPPPPRALVACWLGDIGLAVAAGGVDVVAAGVECFGAGAGWALACRPAAAAPPASRPLGPHGAAAGLLLGEGTKQRSGDETVGLRETGPLFAECNP